MMGGIDQQVQQARLSAGNNPQQLAQRYKQSRNLIDLLAMQKLKSEKDEAAKEMQLQMQTQPNTIVEQREAELMKSSQQDVMSKIAPGMQKAGQASMPQQGAPAPQQAPTGFAKGGIVSYAEGGDVYNPDDPNRMEGDTAETIMRQVAFLKEKGVSEAAVRAAVDSNSPTANAAIDKVYGNSKPPAGNEGIASIMSDSVPTAAPSIDVTDLPKLLGGTPSEPAASAEYLGKKITPSMQKTMDIAKNQEGLDINQVIRDAVYGDSVINKGYRERNPADISAATRAESLKTLANGDESTDLPPVEPLAEPAAPPPAAPPVVAAAPSPADVYRKLVMDKSKDRLNIDPDAQGIAAALRTKAGQKGSAATRAESVANRKKLQGIMDAANDPDKLKRAGIIARLTGMAGQRTTSGALANAGKAGLNIDNRQLMRKKADALGIQKLLDSEYKDQYASEKDVTSAYNTAKAQGELSVDKALNSGTILSNADVRAESAAKLAELTAETNRLIKSNADYAKLQGQQDRLNQREREIKQELAERTDLTYGMQLKEMRKQRQQDLAKGRDSDAAAKLEQINQLQSVFSAQYADELNGIALQRKQLDAQMGNKSSPSARSAQFGKARQVAK